MIRSTLTRFIARPAAALILITVVGGLTLVTAQPAPAQQAAPYEGLYAVSGEIREGRSYKGEVKVVRTGDTYSLAWRIGSEQHLGTGIATGGQLSVVFASAMGAPPGVAVYRKTPDGKILGIYSVLGGTSTAMETWERKGNGQ